MSIRMPLDYPSDREDGRDKAGFGRLQVVRSATDQKNTLVAGMSCRPVMGTVFEFQADPAEPLPDLPAALPEPAHGWAAAINLAHTHMAQWGGPFRIAMTAMRLVVAVLSVTGGLIW